MSPAAQFVVGFLIGALAIVGLSFLVAYVHTVRRRRRNRRLVAEFERAYAEQTRRFKSAKGQR